MNIRHDVPMMPLTTLKVGGPAQFFVAVDSVDALAEAFLWARERELPTTILGWGSNILPADKGVPGLVILNRAKGIRFEADGQTTVETGASFQELFLKTAQRGLGGFEFAVGIPGTVGGALVSNAGAYRCNVSQHLTELEVVQDGSRKWVPKEWMKFSYRDSILRQPGRMQAVVLQFRLSLTPREPKKIYDDARDFQRQRISKQPPMASAGSFFKNVNDAELAARLPALPAELKAAGIVPAGYLLESCGLKGFRHGGGMIGQKHANFLLNVGGATAAELRDITVYAKHRVKTTFGVELEEEVLFIGDWSGYAPILA